MDIIDLKSKYQNTCELKLTDGVNDYYVLANNSAADPESRTIRYSITEEAERLIATSISCTGDISQLQSFLSKNHHGSVWSCSNKKLQKLTAELIINREIVILARGSSEHGHGTFAGEEISTPGFMAIPFDLGGNSKITIRVVDSETGLPVKNVMLKLHNGDKYRELITNYNGVVKLERIKKSSGTDVTSTVMSELGAHIGNTYSFVREGYRSESTEAIKKKPNSSEGKPPNPRRSYHHLAVIKKLKVKKGETLDSVAKQNKMSYQDLAYFNWQQYDSNKISELMARNLGCKNIQGNPGNYVFTGNELPGKIFIPKPLKEEGLSADITHNFQIQAIGYPKLSSINIIVETVHDPDLPESLNDTCTLWSVGDDGSTYKETIEFMDEKLTTKKDNKIYLLFENVKPDVEYSCFLNVKNEWSDKTNGGYFLFDGITITEDMHTSNLPQE